MSDLYSIKLFHGHKLVHAFYTFKSNEFMKTYGVPGESYIKVLMDGSRKPIMKTKVRYFEFECRLGDVLVYRAPVTAQDPLDEVEQ